MSGMPYLNNELKPVEATWSWVSTSQGIVKWTFKNPNPTQVSFVLYRGVAIGDVVENRYLFGDAFYPLYYYDFSTPFQVGQPSPLTANQIQPPLAMFKNPSGTIMAAFIFTLKPNGSWSMEEGGWVNGMQPAGVATYIVNYSETAKFSVNYNQQISCQQYNEQAGTNYPCPPDPFEVESALFMLPAEIHREVSSDVITQLGTSGSNSGGSSGGSQPSGGNCMHYFIEALESGSFRDVVNGILCMLDNGQSLSADLKARFDKVRRMY